MNWLVSTNYVGNQGVHILDVAEGNPAVYDPSPSCVIAGRTFTPCSQTSNTDLRRVLYNQNPTNGQYYGPLDLYVTDGTQKYKGMLLSIRGSGNYGSTCSAAWRCGSSISTTFRPTF